VLTHHWMLVYWLLAAVAAAPVLIGAVYTSHRMRRPGLLLTLAVTASLALTAYSGLRSEPNTPMVDGAVSTRLTLDSTVDYGNLYADSLLPVGDNKYVLDEARKGFVYVCPKYAHVLTTAPEIGANVPGPWFSADRQWYDPSKKVHVEGHVHHEDAEFSETVGHAHIITTNDIPRFHTTGVFPIAPTDAAFSYDQNPNEIDEQNLTYVLPVDPSYGAPQCVGHEVGVMLSGVVLYTALDATGRDAGAWEVQDDCDGHPELTSTYHYHTGSPCIPTASTSEVLGYALDGHPITGAQVDSENVLTTRDLDECHGITSTVIVHGQSVETYHYVLTADFPYTVSCFRGRPIASPSVEGPHQGPPPPH
jgi:hypothetical protein